MNDSVIFEYDSEVVSKTKPWTNENFRGGDDEFQFVIIGDRTGGANAEGTFDLAMSQINLLQPEFVINAGDLRPQGLLESALYGSN